MHYAHLATWGQKVSTTTCKTATRRRGIGRGAPEETSRKLSPRESHRKIRKGGLTMDTERKEIARLECRGVLGATSLQREKSGGFFGGGGGGTGASPGGYRIVYRPHPPGRVIRRKKHQTLLSQSLSKTNDEMPGVGGICKRHRDYKSLRGQPDCQSSEAPSVVPAKVDGKRGHNRSVPVGCISEPTGKATKRKPRTQFSYSPRGKTGKGGTRDEEMPER